MRSNGKKIICKETKGHKGQLSQRSCVERSSVLKFTCPQDQVSISSTRAKIKWREINWRKIKRKKDQLTLSRRLCWSKLSRATIWSYRSLNRLLTTTITFSLSIVPSLLVRKRGGPLCHKNIVARFFCGSMCITWDGVNVVLLLALVLFLTLTSSLATSTTRGHWYSFDGRANNSRGLEL